MLRLKLRRSETKEDEYEENEMSRLTYDTKKR